MRAGPDSGYVLRGPVVFSDDSPATADRSYWHRVGSPTAWHAKFGWDGPAIMALCHREAYGLTVEEADRLPPSAHLCGSCRNAIEGESWAHV